MRGKRLEEKSPERGYNGLQVSLWSHSECDTLCRYVVVLACTWFLLISSLIFRFWCVCASGENECTAYFMYCCRWLPTASNHEQAFLSTYVKLFGMVVELTHNQLVPQNLKPFFLLFLSSSKSKPQLEQKGKRSGRKVNKKSGGGQMARCLDDIIFYAWLGASAGCAIGLVLVLVRALWRGLNKPHTADEIRPLLHDNTVPTTHVVVNAEKNQETEQEVQRLQGDISRLERELREAQQHALDKEKEAVDLRAAATKDEQARDAQRQKTQTAADEAMAAQKQLVEDLTKQLKDRDNDEQARDAQRQKAQTAADEALTRQTHIVEDLTRQLKDRDEELLQADNENKALQQRIDELEQKLSSNLSAQEQEVVASLQATLRDKERLLVEAKQERKELQSMLAEQQSSFHDEERNVDENLEELDAIERRHVDTGDAAAAEDVLSEDEYGDEEGAEASGSNPTLDEQGNPLPAATKKQLKRRSAFDGATASSAAKMVVRGSTTINTKEEIIIVRMTRAEKEKQDKDQLLILDLIYSLLESRRTDAFRRLHLTPSLVKFTKLYLTLVRKAATLREVLRFGVQWPPEKKEGDKDKKEKE